jgi:hypothetical protein
MSLSDKEVAEFHRICDEKNVHKSAADTDVRDAIENGDTTISGLAGWLDKIKATKPHLFVDLAMVDLESRAFGESGASNITARGQLIKALGADEAARRATAWGLRDLHDYKTRGARPTNANVDGKPAKKLDAGNPWSRDGWNVTKQGALYRANPRAAAEIAKAAGSFIGATRPAA